MDRFIFVGDPRTALVGRTGTVLSEEEDKTFVSFDFQPHDHRFVLTKDIAEHGSVQIRGLSLSFCVRDIVKREVNILDVGLITTSTNAADEEAWERMLTRYGEMGWRSYEQEARDVVNLLLFQGKIEQPRTHGMPYPDLGKVGGHWLAH